MWDERWVAPRCFSMKRSANDPPDISAPQGRKKSVGAPWDRVERRRTGGRKIHLTPQKKENCVHEVVWLKKV